MKKEQPKGKALKKAKKEVDPYAKGMKTLSKLTQGIRKGYM